MSLSERQPAHFLLSPHFVSLDTFFNASMILINPMVKHDILASDAQTKVLRPAIQD
jgi:hypothetical protein